MKLNTPLQRIGLILLLLCIVPFLLLSLYWNIAEKSFVSTANVISLIEKEKPKDIEGSFWFRSGNTWLLINKNCNNGAKPHEIEGRSFIPVDCIILEQKDEYGITGKKLDFSSFEKFIGFLIDEKIALWITLLFFTGLFCVTGAMDTMISTSHKFYEWVKTGNWEKN